MNAPEETTPDRSKTALYSWSAGATQAKEKVEAGAPDVVGVHEVCELLRISREALDELRAGEFPVAAELACGPVWDAQRIKEYAAQRKPA
jgi:hypothetical protein